MRINILINIRYYCTKYVGSRLKSMEDRQRPYELRPIKLGCEVVGIDLKESLSDDVVQLIKEDVTEHRILVFRDQGLVSPSRQLQIGRWFGEIESTFYNHSRSPHRDIFRVSNDREQGCTGVGRTGWHIDGSFMSEPFTHSIYHIPVDTIIRQKCILRYLRLFFILVVFLFSVLSCYGRNIVYVIDIAFMLHFS